MIDIQIGILRPELRLRVPAKQDSLPVVRQAMRSLGETVHADIEAIEDAELAVTEACANAVEHAYADGEGHVDVSLTPDERSLKVSVRDEGGGMPEEVRRRSGGRGFGLSLIEGIAEQVEIHNEGGTEIAMLFGMGQTEMETMDGAAPGAEPAERILRRIVAVVAAQQDMPSDRMVEALLVAELVARNALRYLVGEHAEIGLTMTDGGFELSVGLLERGGAQAVVDDSEVPVVGSVVERLVNDVRIESEGETERLVLRVEQR